MTTKETLIECGLRLFSKASYDCVGVQHIVDEASVTKPTLYHHFGSKLGFYEAVYDTYIQPWFCEMMQKMHYERDLIHNLNELALCTVSRFLSDEKLFRMLEYSLNVSSTSESHPFVESRWRPFIDQMQQLFDAAVEQHGNLKDKTVMSAWFFICSLRAGITLILNHLEEYREDLPYRIVHQFMHGIFA